MTMTEKWKSYDLKFNQSVNKYAEENRNREAGILPKNRCGFYSRAAFNYFIKGICAASVQENTVGRY